MLPEWNVDELHRKLVSLTRHGPESDMLSHLLLRLQCLCGMLGLKDIPAPNVNEEWCELEWLTANASKGLAFGVCGEDLVMYRFEQGAWIDIEELSDKVIQKNVVWVMS